MFHLLTSSRTKCDGRKILRLRRRFTPRNDEKAAFTLAEVLITLLIIGVVSSIVIPLIINNTQDAEFKTAWKKAYSDISQAVYKASFDNGGTFLGYITSDDNTMLSLLEPYLSITKKCYKGQTLGYCWHNTNTWYYLSGSQANDSYVVNTIYNGSGVILANGTLLKFVTASSCNGTICGWILADINGFKKPNVIGKDIYGIFLTYTSLKPYGDTFATQNTCDDQHSGWSCASEFLYK